MMQFHIDGISDVLKLVWLKEASFSLAVIFKNALSFNPSTTVLIRLIKIK